MKLTTNATTLGLLAVFAATALSTPVLADSASRQNNKNNWRNLGIAGAVIAGYSLLTHNQTAAVLGAAGAAYSADRYEQDRHSQSQDNADRQWYDRNDGYPSDRTSDYGYGRTYGWNPPASNNHGYDNSPDYDNSQPTDARRDNGRYRGWNQPHQADPNDSPQQAR